MNVDLAADETLSAIAERINTEHELAIGAARSCLTHAIACGEALLDAKGQIARGDWEPWLAANFTGTPQTARGYVRLATYSDLIPPDATNQREVLLYLRGLPGVSGNNASYPEEVELEAQRLTGEGLSQRAVADMLGVSKTHVGRWVGKSTTARREGAFRRRKARERAAREALRRQERDRAMRKVGGSVAHSYSMIRKTVQAVDLAAADATNKEVRQALNAALTKLHHAEDAIVRALGIA